MAIVSINESPALASVGGLFPESPWIPKTADNQTCSPSFRGPGPTRGCMGGGYLRSHRVDHCSAPNPQILNLWIMRIHCIWCFLRYLFPRHTLCVETLSTIHRKYCIPICHLSQCKPEAFCDTGTTSFFISMDSPLPATFPGTSICEES